MIRGGSLRVDDVARRPTQAVTTQRGADTQIGVVTDGNAIGIGRWRLRANRLTRGRLALAVLLLTVGQQHLLTAPADLLSLSFEARQHVKSVRNFISAVSMNVRGACRLFLWCAFKDPRELRLDHPIIVVCVLGKKGCGVPSKIHRENAPCIA